jgi:hypothetical protein
MPTKKYFQCFVILFLCTVFCACSRSDTSTVDKQQRATASKEILPWYIAQYQLKSDRDWQLESEFTNPGYGMYELTQYPNKAATDEQKKQAKQLIEKTFAAVKAKGWLVKEKAEKDGYHNMYKDKIHYVNKEFLYDGETLNPEKPEFLMFYPTEHGELLMGVMFGSVEHGPQIGGPLTLWHYHVEQGICYERGLLPIGQVNENGQCVEGLTSKKTPEMLHLWFFDHPEGRFATRMRLSEEQFELAKEQVLKLYN